ncbi:PREDICTED: UDP-glycosyltransferase [Prunus dulcis]|uniref:PREDICTED: UDP-glycosyltransferase n=1 Tax=Prunus dulcis TaxID=3755 RepID=A0A5E4EB03_PRUDU|nr:UDP-glycosyltransferase 76F1-like [Prunus dulcis]VVA12566.1 PREDICTED: UDP-glycosyltransferase [Prunus dulcis]
MEQSRGLRLILLPLPFQGHINPMLELGNLLHSKGFSITIVHTKFNSLNPSSHPHFTFHSIPVDLSESEASIKEAGRLLSLINAKCVEPFRERLATLLSDAEEDPVACLISDPLLHFTRSVAESFELPRILLRTGGAASFAVYAAFPLLKEKGYLPIQDSRLEEPVTELSPFKVKDLPRMDTCDPESFYQLITNMANEPKASSGLIFNTFEDLEQHALATLRQDSYPNIPIFPIGPFHKCDSAASSSSTGLLTEDQSCISWLNTQAPKSVVYVSFGSIAAVKEAQFLEIAWGLANSNHPFLWVVRPGLVHGSEPLPDGFLESLNGRGHIVKWAPQKQVLAHPAVGAFWTHNGWNSTLESVCEGVPMICMPCFSDQMANARYVSHVWKVGVQIEHGIERVEIERTINLLMVEKEGEDIRDRALKLMEKAIICLKEGGSSYQSLDGLVKHILSIKSFAFGKQSE